MHSQIIRVSMPTSNKVLKIAILTNIIPSYREGFYDRVFSRDDLAVHVYCQKRIPGMNLKAIHAKYPNNIHIINFVAASKERLVWQFLPWKEIYYKYDVVFVDGNPRILNHALLGTLFRFFNKNVVLWTMAHSFRANRLTEALRLKWAQLFNYLFVYTDVEVDYLISRGFNDHTIIGMNNGLDQKSIDSLIELWNQEKLACWRKQLNLDGRTIILSCARLDQKNKFDLLIQALPSIVERFPDMVWCLIGSGEAQAQLASMVNTAGLSDNVRFIGEIYEESHLAPWFLSSEIFVHPGAIGLGLIHAFGYGLPVVTHDSCDHHGPEHAAFKDGLTGRCFRKGDFQHLAGTIIALLNDETREKMRSYVLSIARENYNVDVMVNRFAEIAYTASGRR